MKAIMRNGRSTRLEQRPDALGEVRILLYTNEAVQQATDQRCHRGESPQAMGRWRDRDIAPVRRLLAQVCYQRVATLPLDHIPNAEFQRLTRAREKIFLGPAPAPAKTLPRVPPPAGLPPYLASLYEVPLLTREQEVHLFRKMNYLKYKASQCVARLDPEQPDSRLPDRIENLYQQSVDVKNDIIRANLRLVVALAKRYAHRAAPLFEVISDGNIALIRAVEKFDYARGVKFSTYATWAIIRTFAQTIPLEYRYHTRFLTGGEDAFQATPDERLNEQAEEAAQTRRQAQIARILAHLDDREQQVIRYRFGLGNSCEPMTLREVGNAIGVTKERIRQLQTRALAKLRQAAVEEGLDVSEDGPAPPESGQPTGTALRGATRITDVRRVADRGTAKLLG
jgi:RNA polymerase primary sigma factor